MKIRQTIALAAVLVLVSLLLWANNNAQARLLADEPAARNGAIKAVSAVSPLLQYQGRLTDPGTGDPVADGAYAMIFNLYDVASGGSSLWTETKDVDVQGGLFSTALGDTDALDTSLFDGRALWLGVAVGADPEATPRQQILPVAYALSLAPGAKVSAVSSSPVLELYNTGSGEALHAGGPVGLEGDLTVSGSLIGGSHTHIFTRVLFFPAQGLAHNPTDTAIEANFDGLVWQNVGTAAARLIISRPADWDGESDVTARLFFYPTTSTAGNVQFFIRPRVYDPGDTFLDATGVVSTIAAVSQAGQYNEMQITIPASRFGTKAWWYLVLQRNTTVASPYPDDVVLLSFSLSYSAVQ